jgi:hypothetical protein
VPSFGIPSSTMYSLTNAVDPTRAEIRLACAGRTATAENTCRPVVRAGVRAIVFGTTSRTGTSRSSSTKVREPAVPVHYSLRARLRIGNRAPPGQIEYRQIDGVV